jgi:hypothetical protein
MAVGVNIVSTFDSKGISRAIKDFKKLRVQEIKRPLLCVPLTKQQRTWSNLWQRLVLVLRFLVV